MMLTWKRQPPAACHRRYRHGDLISNMAAQEEEQEQRKKQRREDGATTVAATAAAAAAGPEAAGIPPIPDGSGRRRLVLVHDLDETLLIFNSLLSGTWAAAQQLRGDPMAVSRLVTLGARWEAAILRLCDDRFFFNQLEDFDQTCLADVQPFDDGASLNGYDFAHDGFPPPDPLRALHSPEQHAAAARPTPYAGAGAAAGGTQAATATAAAAGAAGGGGSGSVDGGAGPGSHLDSAASRTLDASSLTRLAYRYRRIALLHKFGLAALGAAAQRAEWESLYKDTDAATGGWLTHANALLAACTAQLGRGSSPASAASPTAAAGGTHSSGDGGMSTPGGPAAAAPLEVVHVAVTSGQLIPSLAKVLLFRLSCHIPAEHLWSSRYRGKRYCFEAVRQRFGADATYVAIGDGIEEDEAAAAMGWPYVRVLLAPAEQYPADTVLSWRPDAATGGPGLPLPQLTVQHIARAAGLGRARPRTPAEGAHGGSAAAAALEGAQGAFMCCI